MHSWSPAAKVALCTAVKLKSTLSVTDLIGLSITEILNPILTLFYRFSLLDDHWGYHYFIQNKKSTSTCILVITDANYKYSTLISELSGN